MPSQQYQFADYVASVQAKSFCAGVKAEQRAQRNPQRRGEVDNYCVNNSLRELGYKQLGPGDRISLKGTRYPRYQQVDDLGADDEEVLVHVRSVAR